MTSSVMRPTTTADATIAAAYAMAPKAANANTHGCSRMKWAISRRPRATTSRADAVVGSSAGRDDGTVVPGGGSVGTRAVSRGRHAGGTWAARGR